MVSYWNLPRTLKQRNLGVGMGVGACVSEAWGWPWVYSRWPSLEWVPLWSGCPSTQSLSLVLALGIAKQLSALTLRWVRWQSHLWSRATQSLWGSRPQAAVTAIMWEFVQWWHVAHSNQLLILNTCYFTNEMWIFCISYAVCVGFGNTWCPWYPRIYSCSDHVKWELP